ncbi:Mu transposase C-terminal domain-containing protein [Deefgea piscis]|uniref:Mu transposase C-terminal domain-containing protein n=1 Tax=Deefgea piscis TaxID=2739061 RepID=UPI001C7F27AF|nr:Mu transposase C-terminal domain-containing protein [Deefgea piscis]QZA82265.1 Mu transposase C-terminal domain-containing protein [Deefgea piscis]
MLFQNQILEIIKLKKRFRVLYINSPENLVWLYSLSDPLAIPQAFSEESIEQALANGDITNHDVDGILTLRSLSETALLRRKKAYEWIEPLIKSPLILQAEFRSKMVIERASELNCSNQTLYKYLRSWWSGGQTVNALGAAFHRCGSQKGNTVRRGRPTKFNLNDIYQLSDKDFKCIKNIIESVYLKNKNCSIDAAHTQLLNRYYSYLNENGQRCHLAPGECPSINQFRYYLKKNYCHEEQIRRRHGDAVFELEHRGKLGSLREETYTVGEVYEVDATIADVYLVHSSNRAKIIGKPTVYMICDRKSNLIVGFYVGIESPCWSAAMHAFKSISEDKEKLCQRYGVHYDARDWPADKIFPQSIFADRGSEMLGKNSSNFAEELKIKVTNLPARRADKKPYIESGFKKLLRPNANSVPGYSPPENFGKRQISDPAQDAALTLHEFTTLVIEHIIKSNKTPLTNSPLSPEYVLNDILPTPINIWNLEVRDRAGQLTRFSENQVLFALLEKEVVSVTPEGIKKGKCYYSSPEAEARGWFSLARNGISKVTISFDKRLADKIYVHDIKSENGYFIASLLDKCDKYRGLSFEEVKVIEDEINLAAHISKPIKKQLAGDFLSNTEDMIKNAIAETKKATKGLNRKSRKKDTVEARKDERHTQRQTEANLDREDTLRVSSEVEKSLSSQSIQKQAPKSVSSLLDDMINGK